MSNRYRVFNDTSRRSEPGRHRRRLSGGWTRQCHRGASPAGVSPMTLLLIYREGGSHDSLKTGATWLQRVIFVALTSSLHALTCLWCWELVCCCFASVLSFTDNQVDPCPRTPELSETPWRPHSASSALFSHRKYWKYQRSYLSPDRYLTQLKPYRLSV